MCWATFIAILGCMRPFGPRLDTPAPWEWRRIRKAKGVFLAPSGGRAGSENEPKAWRQDAGLEALLCHWLVLIISLIVLGLSFLTHKMGTTTPSQANHFGAVCWNETVEEVGIIAARVSISRAPLQSGGPEQGCWSSYTLTYTLNETRNWTFWSFETHPNELPQASHLLSNELPVNGGMWAEARKLLAGRVI